MRTIFHNEKVNGKKKCGLKFYIDYLLTIKVPKAQVSDTTGDAI